MDISTDDFIAMIISDTEAKKLGSVESRVDVIEVDVLDERVIDSIEFRVTKEASEEAELILSALVDAESTKNSPEQFMSFISNSISTVLAELTARRSQVLSSACGSPGITMCGSTSSSSVALLNRASRSTASSRS